MRILTAIFFIFLSLGAIAGARRAPQIAPSPSPSQSGIPLPSASPRITFKPDGAVTDTQRKLLAEAEGKLASLQALPAFHAFLAKRAVVQIEPMTPAQFADKARDAQGSFGVRIYHIGWPRSMWTSEVGLDGSGGVIQIRDVALTDACNVASLMAHEGIGHNLLKLAHDFNDTVRRPFSGPYSLNAAVEALCK